MVPRLQASPQLSKAVALADLVRFQSKELKGEDTQNKGRWSKKVNGVGMIPVLVLYPKSHLLLVGH